MDGHPEYDPYYYGPSAADVLEDTYEELNQTYKRMEKLENLLLELRDWFDDRSDADHDGENFVPNIEMIMAQRIDEVLA